MAQDYSNLEILVCDNASTDGTDAYMATLEDPRIRYIRHAENVGANGNFNSCLENATGEYFLLLHDDDVLEPGFVSSCVDALPPGGVGVVRTGVRVIDANGRIMSETPANEGGLDGADVLLRWFQRKAALYFASTLYNTRRLREIGGFDSPHGLYQDVKATVILMARYGQVAVPRVLANFRRHDDNRGTSVRAIQWAEDAVHLLEVIAAEYPAKRAELLALGNIYLCQKCFRIASSISDVGVRWRTYREIAALFDGGASPLWYEVRRYWGLARGSVGRIRTVMLKRDATAH